MDGDREPARDPATGARATYRVSGRGSGATIGRWWGAEVGGAASSGEDEQPATSAPRTATHAATDTTRPTRRVEAPVFGGWAIA